MDRQRLDSGSCPVVLGFVQSQYWCKLAQLFNSNNLELSVESIGSENFIPPWAFEYPKQCYAEQNARLLKCMTWQFAYVNGPNVRYSVAEDLQRREVADELSSAINSNKFIECVLEMSRSYGRLSRPVIYCAMLRRFCDLLKGDQKSALDEWKSIGEMVFVHRSDFVSDHAADDVGDDSLGRRSLGPLELLCRGERSAWSWTVIPKFVNSHSFPLGLFDPLQTIKELYVALHVVLIESFDHLVDVSNIKLTARGMLHGYGSRGTKVTILAYCGGKVLTRKEADSDRVERAGHNTRDRMGGNEVSEFRSSSWSDMADPIDDIGGIDGTAAEPACPKYVYEPLAPCGAEPLFLQSDNACECGKLRCSRCGFCSKVCPRCFESQCRAADVAADIARSGDRVRGQDLSKLPEVPSCAWVTR